MEGLYLQVLKEMGLKSRGSRKEKSCYVCNTDKGFKAVQKTRLTAEMLEFAHFIKERLYEAGFTETDRFAETEGGKPYVEAGGELYIAPGYVDGREARFDEKEQLKDVIRQTARMHRLAAIPGFFDGAPIRRPSCKEYGVFLPDTGAGSGFDRQIKLMRGYRKMVKRQGRLSNFDITFLKCFEGYERRLVRSVELSSRDGVTALLTGSAHSFAHNLIKEETVLIKDGKVFITGFGESSADSFLFDLASIIKRHARSGGTFLPMNELLETYSKENPLSEKEITALYAVLLIPDKFYKLSVKYYSKKRTWTPASFEGTLEGLNEHKEVYEQYVAGYFDKKLNI